jgi:hypothetical protein
MSNPKIEWTLDDKPLSTSDLYLSGLRDVQGTFSGNLNMDSSLMEMFYPDGVQTIYIYGPRRGNLIQHWFWKIRERLFDIPYPSEVIFSGPAEFTMTTDNDNVTATGTFKWPPSE